MNLSLTQLPVLPVGLYGDPAWEAPCSMFPDATHSLASFLYHYCPQRFTPQPLLLLCSHLLSSQLILGPISLKKKKNTHSFLDILQAWGKLILPTKESTACPALSSILDLRCWVRPSQLPNFRIHRIRSRKQLLY